MFSGAQWRSNPDLSDRQQISWDHATLLHWRDLIANNPPAVLGLEACQAEFYWDTVPDHPPVQEHWWSIQNFVPIREIGAEECIKRGFGAGFKYNTVAVNPALYCAWLLRQCENHGVEKLTLPIGSFGKLFEAVPQAAAAINCTGVNAGQLVKDQACFATKGQTVLVRGKSHKIVTRRNEVGEEPWEALVIPRPGENVTMLGGCKLVGDWNTEPDDRLTKLILDRCKPLAPELLTDDGKFDILSVRVGLRPSRTGGPRVQIEELEGGKFVVHSYGHHSAGFEGSVGAAEEVAALLADRLKMGN
jgi:D-amino-acid oxidase